MEIILFLVVVVVFFSAVFGLFYLNNDYEIKKEDKMREKQRERIIIQEEKKMKGYSFEQQITMLCQEYLPGSIVLNNVILFKRSKNGKDIYVDGKPAMKETDVIILSKKGLFVVEAKNYNQAFVSGGIDDKQWIASYSKSKVYKIYSPLKQVTESVTTLKRYLPSYNFRKFVVFPNSAKVSRNLKATHQVKSFEEFRLFLLDVSSSEDILEKSSLILIKDLLVEENTRARNYNNGNGENEHLDFVKKMQNQNNQETLVV